MIQVWKHCSLLSVMTVTDHSAYGITSYDELTANQPKSSVLWREVSPLSVHPPPPVLCVCVCSQLVYSGLGSHAVRVAAGRPSYPACWSRATSCHNPPRRCSVSFVSRACISTVCTQGLETAKGSITRMSCCLIVAHANPVTSCISPCRISIPSPVQTLVTVC